MKLFIIIPGKPEGNSMIFSKRQVADLRDQGMEVCVHYLTSRTNPLFLIKELFRIRAAVRLFKPDIVHAHYGTMTAILGAFSGASKFAITFHGSDLNYVRTEFFLKEIIAKCFSQLAVLKADIVFCVSGRLKQKLWWKRKYAVVIPFGVNLQNYIPLDRQVAREKLNIPSHSRLVLFNNSAPIKRFDIANAAIEHCRENGADLELYSLSGSVEFDTMLLLLNACDCLLICSDSEGSPVMVKEAMACNLPVVATDVGDVVSVIEGSQPVGVASQERKSIAQAIMTVINDGQRSNGRELIIKKGLDSAGITTRLIEIYSDVINNE